MEKLEEIVEEEKLEEKDKVKQKEKTPKEDKFKKEYESQAWVFQNHKYYCKEGFIEEDPFFPI